MPENSIQYDGPVPELQTTDPRVQLAQLEVDNQNAVNALAQQGAAFNDAALLRLRIDLLAEMTLGALPAPGRVHYELTFQRRVAEAIAAVRTEIGKAKLAAAAQASPEQLRQMAAAQGLLGPDGKPLR